MNVFMCVIMFVCMYLNNARLVLKLFSVKREFLFKLHLRAESFFYMSAFSSFFGFCLQL